MARVVSSIPPALWWYNHLLFLVTIGYQILLIPECHHLFPVYNPFYLSSVRTISCPVWITGFFMITIEKIVMLRNILLQKKALYIVSAIDLTLIHSGTNTLTLVWQLQGNPLPIPLAKVPEWFFLDYNYWVIINLISYAHILKTVQFPITMTSRTVTG